MSIAQKYHHTQVMTATPMELVLMLYDACITALDNAEKAFAIEGPDRIQHISNNILHAEDIITELAVSLDMEKGGDVANNLHRLYDFMIYHLSQANIKKDVNAILDVRKMMVELREAWQKVKEQEPARSEDAMNAPSRGTVFANG
ncbi:MAG: flagellar export chaperone FliS [Lentisphaerae bacterium]|nr:flagellar export chaperone FliS [Lentisphaerota bacterium]